MTTSVSNGDIVTIHIFDNLYAPGLEVPLWTNKAFAGPWILCPCEQRSRLHPDVACNSDGVILRPSAEVCPSSVYNFMNFEWKIVPEP